MKPTIRSIAQVLELSPATISKALSGRTEISTETRTRVMRCAKEMGYFKNQASRKRVAILVANPNDHSDINSTLLYDSMVGFRKDASRLQQEVLMFTMDPHEQERETLDEFAQSHQLVGIFISGLRINDPYYTQLATTKTPIAVLDVDVKNPYIGSVGTNSIAGGRLAVGYLATLGHKKIAFVNGRQDAYISQERLAGYLGAMNSNGLDIASALIFNGNYTAESGERAAEYFAKADATAIYFASDLMALGAVRRFRELGVNIPGDISLIGFDNLPICQGCMPALSTIAQDRIGLGKAACTVLYCLMQELPVHNVRLEPELVVRESTASPK